MKKEFVSYEIALELKELGFDETCLFAYYGKSDISNFKESDHVLCGDRHNTSFQKDGRVSAPLHQHVFRWFREKYGLDSYIMPLETKKVYDYYIWFSNKEGEKDLRRKEVKLPKLRMNNQYTYEEAENECLLKLIEFAIICNLLSRNEHEQ